MAEESKVEADDALLSDTVKTKVVAPARLDVLEDEGRSDAVAGQKYDHDVAQVLVSRLCEKVMENLLKLRKPFKYVVNSVIMRKCGAGAHVCCSAQMSATSDGCYTEFMDVTDTIWCVVTVFWCAL